MSYLSHLEISSKGEHVAMVSTQNGPELMAVMWVDRDRRYFISSSGTINPGIPIYRERRWRTRNGVTRKEEMSINIPDVCEKYYETCSEIDKHNRCRQDDLGLERKFEVKESGSGVGTHLTPTNRKRKKADGTLTSACYQSRCGVCKEGKNSKFICSSCKTYLKKEIFICHHQSGRDCFKKHVNTCHDLSYKGSFY